MRTTKDENFAEKIPLPQIFYKQRRLRLMIYAGFVKLITFCTELRCSGAFGTGGAPGEPGKAQALPADPGGQDQEPCDKVTAAYPAAQIAEKLAVSGAVILAKYQLADLVNKNGYEDEPNEQQA